MMCCPSLPRARVAMVKKSKSDSGGPEEGATLIDEALGQEVAVKLRELRQEMAKKKDLDADDFSKLSSEQDDAPTMWDVGGGPSIVELDQETVEQAAYSASEGRLGSAVPVVIDEPEHTERSELPLIEP